MNQYAITALKAVELILNKEYVSPIDAWEKATQTIIKSQSSREKGCPREAFLGLCEEGLINGVSSGDYTNSNKNKRYAIIAVELLKKDPNLINNKKKLWRTIQEDGSKTQNGQLDIVIALWQKKLIK